MGLFKTRRRFAAAVFAVMLCLVFVRFCAYGLRYFPQLDDYIQYHDYVNRGLSVAETVDRLGLLAARPLAGLADVCFWSLFFDDMIVGVLIVSAMLAGSAVLFWLVFNDRFGTGPVFFPVYALLPAAFEGTYWMSASTRVVSGLFFASLALYFFCAYMEKGGAGRLLAYMFSQVLCAGFYEQALVLSVTSVLLFAALEVKKTKRAFWGLFSIAAIGLYFAFTSAFSDSALYGGRTGVVLPTGAYYFKNFLPSVAKQIAAAFCGGGFYTMTKGALRGAELILRDRLLIYAAAALVFAVMFFLLFRSTGFERKRTLAAVIISLLLIAAPMAPFFVLESSWYSMRSVVTSLCGTALLIDTLASAVLRGKKGYLAGFAAMLAIWCCICSVSELHDYRDTTRDDMAVVSAAAEAVEKDGLMSSGLKVGFLNVEASYLDDQNFSFHEHIHGVTESGWAFTGALEYLIGPDRPGAWPMPASPCFSAWNREDMDPGSFDALYMYADGVMSPVTAAPSEQGWDILSADGVKISRIVLDEKGGGWLRPA